jgi:TonB family protein
VNLKRQPRPLRPIFKILLGLFFVLVIFTCVRAQTPAQTPSQAPAPTPEQTTEPTTVPTTVPTLPAPSGAAPLSASETEAVQRRLARARSLAAIGRLAAAASDLESLRSSTADESVRDVTRVLLVAIFVEMPDYARAGALLEEAYKARSAGQTGDAATHTYFALAGQMLNAVRTHLDRYRSFGINVADGSELSPEANGDLEQLRGLLERVVEHARALHEEEVKGGEGTRGTDAAALLEDAATVRTRIARHDQDRARWQAEVSEARQHLFSSEMRIASISDIPANHAAAAASQPATTNPNAPAADKPSQPGAGQKSAKKSRQPAPEQGRKSETAAGAQPPMAAPGAQPDASKPSVTPEGGGRKIDDSPVAVGSLAGKAKQRISPTYPPVARAARVSGVVTVYLVVSEKGEVETVQRADGPPQLQQAAAEAARRWKFSPTVIDGQPVRVTGYLSFNFTL